MFNELRWILCSQTLIIVHNIVIKKEQNVLKCFFHIVNNIKEKEKSVKLEEMTGYFWIIVFSVVQSVLVCSYLPPSGAYQNYRTVIQEKKSFKQPPKSSPNSKIVQNLFKFLCCLWRKSNQNRVNLTAGLLLG